MFLLQRRMKERMILEIWVLFFFLIFFFGAQVSSFDLFIRTNYKNAAIIKHFWKSTGFCPVTRPKEKREFLLSADEKSNLDLIGALPNQSIKMIRIHWLLDLVKVRSNQFDDEPEFLFGSLDLLIDRLHRNGLSPIFEIMGNPSNYFHDFKKQAQSWSKLLRQIITRYGAMFGFDYVKSWRFELGNEPDLKLYNSFNFTLESYLDYFRASESAVGKLSGPAGLFGVNRKFHILCWGLLDYCNSNPCNLDMVTFHRKGDEVGSRVVDSGLELINSLISNYSNLKGIPFGNDEADIMKKWDKPVEWRADVRYAAAVVQVIIGHIEEMLIKRNISFELLSNDNAFLSFSPNYFTQRTLLARFQINNTSPPHVQFFKKPVYAVMGLLSLLGNIVKDIRYRPVEKGFSYLVTRDEFHDSFLGVLSNDRVNETCEIDSSMIVIRVKIALRNSNLPGICVGYIMDNVWDNPHKVWRDGGSPDFPNRDLRKRMRRAEGFRKLFIRRFEPHQRHIKVYLKNVFTPTVFAAIACFANINKPGPVADLKYEKVFLNEILLFWKDALVGSRCLLTYSVEFRTSKVDTFRRINRDDSIFLSYHFDGNDVNGSSVGVIGEYRVRAIDYWNRLGSFSNVLIVTG